MSITWTKMFLVRLALFLLQVYNILTFVNVFCVMKLERIVLNLAVISLHSTS